jgi:hypothetical protein
VAIKLGSGGKGTLNPERTARMYLSLLTLGVMVTLAGAAMLAFGIPINEFGLGNTLIIAGTAAFVGGLILIGVSEAVRQLRRIAESLMARPVGQMPRGDHLFEPVSSGAPPAASRVPFPPKPEPRRRAPAPAMAPEPRLDIAPSLAAMQDQFDRPPPAFARGAPEPRVVPERDDAPLSPRAEPRFTAAPVEKDELAEGLLATAFSRLEVELQNAPPAAAAAPAPAAEAAKQDDITAKQDDMFESLWPPEPRRDSFVVPAQSPPQAEAEYEQPAQEPRLEESRLEESRLEEARPEEARQEEPRQEEPRQEEPRQEEPRQEEPRREEPRQEEPRREEPWLEEQQERQEEPAEPYAISILKSGVVDGMAYTLYSDGSIEAEMPEGTMRFASITELRAHLEKSSA